jgi:selenocysteine-specific elongation factor
MVLAAPGVLQPVVTVDVRLRATSILAHPLEHDAGLTFLSATAETEAKVRLLDRDSVGRSEEAWAQAVLSEPLALRRGDHCVLRSPNETVGGGVIVALNPRRHRRKHQPTLDALELQLAGSPAERLLESLAAGPIALGAVAGLLSCTADEAAATVRDLVDSAKAKVEGGLLASGEWIAVSVGRLERAIGDYLEANPLRAAAPREHVRSAVGLQPAAFELAVAEGVSSGVFEGGSGGLAPAGYTVQLTPPDREEAEAFVAAVLAGGFSPPTDAVPRAALLSYLVDAGEVEDTGAGVVFARDVFDEMVRMTREHAANGGTISMGEIRDLFGTSRKYAQAFLEHLDALHITRRVGDVRILRGGAFAP